MNKSIPCPFCGSEDYYITVTDNPFSYDTYSTAHCSKCHATGPFVAESYLEDEPKPTRDYMEAVAKEKWQTRPIEDELQKRIAELEAESERFTVHSDIERQDAEERAHLEKLVSSLKARIAGLEAANDALLKDNDILFRAIVAKSPNDTQTDTVVYGKESEE